MRELHDLQANLRTRAAWLYYIEGLTVDAVSQVLGIARTRVTRMLAAAREDGTVQIRVTTERSRCAALSRRLEKRFGLERAMVIPVPQDATKISELIGAATGAYLDGILSDRMTVGLGWGRTLSSCLPFVTNRRFEQMSVVSLLGGLTPATVFNPSEFAWRFANRLGAECFMLTAPIYAPDARTREALVNHVGFEDIFRRAEKLDLAIVSVGDLSPGCILGKIGVLHPEEMSSLLRAGAVGDILCRFFDENGAVLDHPLNYRVISADPKVLRNARRVVLASGGWDKLAAIRASMKLIKPHVLITDETVAEAMTLREGHQ